MTAADASRDLRAHFTGLANPTRLAILGLLSRREMAASELARKLKLSQPLLSWHLRIMRRASLIATRRSGREVFCSVDRAAIRDFQHRFDQFIGGSAAVATLAEPDFAGVTETENKEIANAV